jgi:nucleoside-diphosphate-sugar epimerase
VPLDLPGYARTTLDAEAQAQRFTDAGGTGVVLRFGMFYGPDGHTTMDTVRLMRWGIAPGIGGASHISSIHTDDAAAAVVAALRAPAGVYNVVDNEPVTRREYAASLARALGRPAPRMAPRAAGAVLGSRAAVLSRSQRVSNRRFRGATGWAPRWLSVREGWPAVVGAMGETAEASSPARRQLLRWLLGLLAASSLVVGLWAQLATSSRSRPQTRWPTWSCSP